ncbi:MAG TPA: MFS transporter [Terriglobia bacterium]|nr:MFS transporter [Terriglobia bacterium]
MSASSGAPAEREEAVRNYYGWRVVLAANLGVMTGFGSLFVFTFSVFLKPLGAEFGWNREDVSRGFALAAIMVAVCSPTLGRWLDRLGPRRIILPCMAVYGCAYASQAFLGPHLWQFYATCIVIGAVGNATTQMGYARAVSSWFSARRGMALALVMAGTGAGSIILPLLAETLITASGWRAAYLGLGLLALALGVPLTWRFVREREHGHTGSNPLLRAGVSWRRALRLYSFWVIVAMLMLSSLSLNGAVAHLVALLTDRGISPQRAALSASVLGGASLGGRLLVGSLLDRFWGPRVAFVMLMAAAGGIFLLGRAGGLPAGCLAAALIGLGLGGEADITPYLLTRYFGLRSFSTLYGLTWSFYAVAGGIGPVVMGRAYDLTGSYSSLLTVLGSATALAAVLMLLLPRYSSSPLTDSYA